MASSLTLDYFLHSFPFPWWSWCLLLALVLSSLYLFRPSRKSQYSLSHLPWVGVREEWFATARANLRELSDCKTNIETGYKQHGKFDRPFVTPNQTGKPEVVLPTSFISWLVAQPDSALSIYQVLIDDVEFKYTSPRSWAFHRPFHVEALNKMDLNRMTPVMMDEIELRVDELFGGTTEEWTHVDLSKSMYEILTRITSRVFVGKELAHDSDYYRYANKFVSEIVLYVNIISRLLPSALKPIFGPIIAFPVRYYDYRCSLHLVPILTQVLQDAEDGKANHNLERNPDILRLMARYAAKSHLPEDKDPRSLCSRLLALNFVGIHTSSSAAINAMIDLLCCGETVFNALRAEAATALRDAGGCWTKPAVNKLVLLDSFFRESLRFSAFKARGVERQVIQKGGLTLPDGSFLPEGTKIGVPTTEVHMDPDFYDDPTVFRYDRFVGTAELGIVNTTNTFLAFGHGKHACPGRFFSAHELKLLFSHLILNYDFSFLETRPQSRFFSDFFIWTEKVLLEVHHRRQSAHLDAQAPASHLK